MPHPGLLGSRGALHTCHLSLSSWSPREGPAGPVTSLPPPTPLPLGPPPSILMRGPGITQLQPGCVCPAPQRKGQDETQSWTAGDSPFLPRGWTELAPRCTLSQGRRATAMARNPRRPANPRRRVPRAPRTAAASLPHLTVSTPGSPRCEPHSWPQVTASRGLAALGIWLCHLLACASVPPSVTQG